MSFFKPSDFDDENGGYGPYAERLARLANALLTEHAVTLLGSLDSGGGMVFREIPSAIATHSCLAVCIEELAPKVCSHDAPIEWLFGTAENPKKEITCYRCGVRLKMKWEVVE